MADFHCHHCVDCWRWSCWWWWICSTGWLPQASALFLGADLAVVHKISTLLGRLGCGAYGVLFTNNCSFLLWLSCLLISLHALPPTNSLLTLTSLTSKYSLAASSCSFHVSSFFNYLGSAASRLILFAPPTTPPSISSFGFQTLLDHEDIQLCQMVLTVSWTF